MIGKQMPLPDEVLIHEFRTGGVTPRRDLDKMFVQNTMKVAGAFANNNVNKTPEYIANMQDSVVRDKLVMGGVITGVLTYAQGWLLDSWGPYFFGAAGAVYLYDKMRGRVVQERKQKIDEATGRLEQEGKNHEFVAVTAAQAGQQGGAIPLSVTVSATRLIGAAEKTAETCAMIGHKRLKGSLAENIAVAATGVAIAALSASPAAALVGGIWLVGAVARQAKAYQQKKRRDDLLSVLQENIDGMKAGYAPPSAAANWTRPQPDIPQPDLLNHKNQQALPQP